jgi:hypothetical protein
MGKPAVRDEILDQIRRMSPEDRDYIEAEPLRDRRYETDRGIEDPARIAELVRRASESLTRSDAGRLARTQVSSTEDVDERTARTPPGSSRARGGTQQREQVTAERGLRRRWRWRRWPGAGAASPVTRPPAP